MTKYSSEFKVNLVREWATDGLISYQLAKKYHLSHHYIQYWIEQARLQGITSLQHRRVKRTFSADFKLSVINYYQTHEESMAMVAAKYDLLPNQISHWKRDFHQGGYQALKPHPKGRPPKVKKKNRKALKKQVNKNEIERLKEELAQTKQELYDVKMDRDILKKSLALFGPSKLDKKHK